MLYNILVAFIKVLYQIVSITGVNQMITLKQRADEAIVVILGDQEVIIKLKEVDHDQAKLDVQADENVHITHKFSRVEYTD